MRPFFSVAIPTWEVNGLGKDYLYFSFNRLVHQTFTDFEVVVSDHSVNDDIEKACELWSQHMSIVYVRNSEGRGKIAPNLNNALRHCSGEYIKILFQDDFLYDEHSLMHIKDTILADHANYLTSEVRWLLNSCYHTKDGENLFDRMTPSYHDHIHRGINTISCPSVLTIKNDTETLAFDETYNWLVDCVYYKEMFTKFGPPRILDEVCIVNRDSQVRTTNMLSEAQKAEEVIRATKKYETN
jgi:glycosyltransferase involved in cell wall biosynthesis